MRRRRRRPVPGPRLVDVLISRGADETKIRDAVEQFYGKCGKFLVSGGYITKEELSDALAQQAAESGDYRSAASYVHERLELAHRGIVGHLESLVTEAAHFVSAWQPARKG